MNIDRLIKWLEGERKKDRTELEISKRNSIIEIKNLKKEDLFKSKPTKLTLWQRLKKTLMGS